MKIDTIITDIDGVLTDGGYYWSAEGLLFKKFNTRDASAAKRFVEAGYKLFIVTSCDDEVTKSRMRRMRNTAIRYLVDDKLEAVKQLIDEYNLRREAVCYIGDDYMDIAAMSYCGTAACPADATWHAHYAANYMCERSGGEGVLAEIVDMVMRGKFDDPDLG